jgi:hypothetical protein
MSQKPTARAERTLATVETAKRLPASVPTWLMVVAFRRRA